MLQGAGITEAVDTFGKVAASFSALLSILGLAGAISITVRVILFFKRQETLLTSMAAALSRMADYLEEQGGHRK